MASLSSLFVLRKKEQCRVTVLSILSSIKGKLHKEHIKKILNVPKSFNSLTVTRIISWPIIDFASTLNAKSSNHPFFLKMNDHLIKWWFMYDLKLPFHRTFALLLESVWNIFISGLSMSKYQTSWEHKVLYCSVINADNIVIWSVIVCMPSG